MMWDARDGPPPTGPLDEAWQTYCSCKNAQRLANGTFVLEIFQKLSYLPNDEINVEVWNSYWESFTEMLDRHDTRKKIHSQTLTLSGSLTRVIVALAPNIEGYDCVPLLSLAGHFGVVEYFDFGVTQCVLQFTSASAANAFKAVVVAEGPRYLPSGKRTKLGVTARVVPGADVSSETLCFGRGKLPQSLTLYVQALFCSVFEAAQVVYQCGTFFVHFRSKTEAREVLHLLHMSFAVVFRQALTFNAVPSCQQAQPFERVSPL